MALNFISFSQFFFQLNQQADHDSHFYKQTIISIPKTKARNPKSD